MNLRTFILINESLLRIINEGYSDLNPAQQYKVSMNLQNTLIKDYINEKSSGRLKANITGLGGLY